jgi:uncharacterized protein with HEPN domain
LRNDGVYLEYIEESIDLINQYLRGQSGTLDQNHFREHDLTRDAVLHRLETLAEATSHLSSELRDRHPAIDWRRITNFCNVLAHGYVDLDVDLIWKTIVEDLPALRAVIELERS